MMTSPRHRTAWAAGLVALAACGTAPVPAPAWTPRVIPPHVVDGGVGYVEGKPREYYACSKYAERAGLGGFTLRRGFTLDGAPYKSVNESSWVSAHWNTLDWRAPSSNPRSKDYHYYVSWNGEVAETVSLETDIWIWIQFLNPHAENFRARIVRKDGQTPERSIGHDFSWSGMEGSSATYASNNRAYATLGFAFPIADLLTFAGTESELIATEYDAKGAVHQTVELDMQELRDGIAMMRELMTSFQSETKDYATATACRRDFDWKIYLTGG